MRTRPVLLNNRFKASQEQDFDPKADPLVFISYKRSPDFGIAYECARILDSAGINYWIDEEDECIANAQSWASNTKKAIETAKCIEKGLDVSSALLSIIGPETWNTPWVPYEIGGARGRQRFSILFTDAPPHPLIAHLIRGNINDAPDFVALGTPLTSLYEVTQWAKSVVDILEAAQKESDGKLLIKTRREIRSYHGIEEIYRTNTKHLSL